jgi:hypothetical protein
LWFSLLASTGKREIFVTKCRWLDFVEAMLPTCQFSAALYLLNQCFFVGIMTGF